jgi:hypothetical protein
MILWLRRKSPEKYGSMGVWEYGSEELNSMSRTDNSYFYISIKLNNLSV